MENFETIMKRIDLKVARMKAELYIDAYYEQGMEIKDFLSIYGMLQLKYYLTLKCK